MFIITALFGKDFGSCWNAFFLCLTRFCRDASRSEPGSYPLRSDSLQVSWLGRDFGRVLVFCAEMQRGPCLVRQHFLPLQLGLGQGKSKLSL